MQSLEGRLDGIGNTVIDIRIKAFKQEGSIPFLSQSVNRITNDLYYNKEKTDSSPKIYDSIEILIGRFKLDDQERTFLTAEVALTNRMI